MMELKQTEVFRAWREGLKAKRARSILAKRLSRLAYGLYGDVKPVGEGISELRIDYGPRLSRLLQAPRQHAHLSVVRWR